VIIIFNVVYRVVEGSPLCELDNTLRSVRGYVVDGGEVLAGVKKEVVTLVFFCTTQNTWFHWIEPEGKRVS